MKEMLEMIKAMNKLKMEVVCFRGDEIGTGV